MGRYNESQSQEICVACQAVRALNLKRQYTGHVNSARDSADLPFTGLAPRQPLREFGTGDTVCLGKYAITDT